MKIFYLRWTGSSSHAILCRLKTDIYCLMDMTLQYARDQRWITKYGQAVSKWESGGSPDIEMLESVADYFDISMY